MNTAPKLPLWSVLLRAFALPWERNARLLQAVILPLVIVIALSIVHILVLYPVTHLIGWLWQLAYSLSVAWVAVSIHRHVLIDAPRTNPEAPVAIARRIVLYAIALAILWMLFIGLFGIFCRVFEAALMGSADDSMARVDAITEHLRVTLLAAGAAAIVTSVFAGRLCLLLPAISIGENASAAVLAARGNTLRLTVVFAVLPLALSLLGELLYQDSSTKYELVLFCVFGALFLVIEITALSLAYRELISRAPPPTHPPA